MDALSPLREQENGRGREVVALQGRRSIRQAATAPKNFHKCNGGGRRGIEDIREREVCSLVFKWSPVGSLSNQRGRAAPRIVIT
jgi:hypothetical protein